jgi:hypothetical protein
VSDPEDLTPEEEQVRRLLADARHTAPLPDDVAARLDAVLADLSDEDPSAPGPVVASRRPIDLAAARRRRNARSWLIAAAAVVAIGFGVNQVAHIDVSGSEGDASSADSSAVSGREVERPGDDAAGAGQDSGDVPAAPSAQAPSPEFGPDFYAAPLRLHTDRFGAQVTRIRDRAERAKSDAGNFSTASGSVTYDGLGLLHAYRSTCPTADWGRGHAVPVRYDGRPGVLIFRQVRGDTQVADLFLCGSDQPERSITLPAP